MSNPLYNPHKFDYHSLERIATKEGRKYITPDGFAVPSVTTILDATKSEKSKKALADWRKSIGEKAANDITATASGRGTRMHKYLENYIKDGATGDHGSNPYSKQAHKMANIVIDNGLTKCNEFWATEASLYYPECYAGTTDLVGVHENSEAIMDFKQANKEKKREWIEDYFIQLASYATAHNEIWNTNIRKGVVLMCTAEFQYQEFVIEGKEFDHYVDQWFRRLEQYYQMFV